MDVIVTAKLVGTSPLSQSRFHDTPRREKERPDAYEERTWMNRLHVNTAGNVILPPMMAKNALSEIARFLAMQIPGKGKSTYTKHFGAGVLVVDPIDIGVKATDVAGEWLFVPASGKRGDGKRVKKCFPRIDQWEGMATFHVFDENITEKVFHYHLVQAGKFIGVGRFRPRNNGFYGRFAVENMKWEWETNEEG